MWISIPTAATLTCKFALLGLANFKILKPHAKKLHNKSNVPEIAARNAFAAGRMDLLRNKSI